jgi:hypothetical protein
MASTIKHLRSSTADKRPTASGLADGQLAINTASGTPGLFLKDNAGAVVKVGPVHVGATAPNATPAGSSGNSKGELWVNDTTTIHGLNYYTGSAFVNLTPSGTATTAGLVELATNAETQAGTDTVRAVTPSGLQSKVSDSTSTTSSTTIASSTAVKAAFDLANAALPKSGGRVTGNLEIGPTGSLSFEGSTDDSFETFLEVVNPTADRTITFPNVTGTVITTGDTGTVTSAMITDGTIVNADINASAGIVDTKLATISTAGKVSNSATTAVSTNTVNAIVTRDGSGNFSAGTITANLTGTASAIADNTVTSAKIVDGAIVNVDVNASAAIAGTKISPNFGSQTITTTGVISPALGTAAAPSIAFTGDPNTGIYSPGADQVAVATNGSERLRITSAGLVGIGTSAPNLPLTVTYSDSGTIPTSGLFDETSGGLQIRNSDSAASFAGLYLRARTTNSANALIGVRYNTTLSDGDIFFKLRNATFGSIEPLTIKALGYVGIGTTSPENLLHVAGSGAGAVIVERTGNTLNSHIQYKTTSGSVYAGQGNANAFAIGNDTNLSAGARFAQFSSTDNIFYTSGSERARLTSTGALLIGTTVAPTGAGSGAVVAQDRMVISSQNAGRHQVIAGETGTMTATTGTVVFKFIGTTSTARSCYVKLAIANRANNSTPSNLPAAEYAFQLHRTGGGVCSLNGATTIFQFTYVYATHVAFADLGNGECTVTLTNPTALAQTGSYKVEVLTEAGNWTLDSVTTT